MKPKGFRPPKKAKNVKRKFRGTKRNILRPLLLKNNHVWHEKIESLENEWNALDNSFGLEQFHTSQYEQPFSDDGSTSYYHKSTPPSNEDCHNYLLHGVNENSLIIDCEDQSDGQEFHSVVEPFNQGEFDSDVMCEDEEPPSEILIEEELQKTEDEYVDDKNIKAFAVPEKSIIIVLLQHPFIVGFEGLALMCVISGKVCVLGHEIESSDVFIPLYSTRKLLYLDIKTVKSEKICRQTALLQIVKQKLGDIGIENGLSNDILDSCDNTSVILAFKKNFKANDIHFSCSLNPPVFNFTKRRMDSNVKHCGFKISPLIENLHLNFCGADDFINDVLSCSYSSGGNSGCTPKVLVQGRKGVGKSTLLRYFINKTLNGKDYVYFLDGDPGQSEFTPPGCISLVRVAAPLLGPAFTHLQTPEKMFFLGRISAEGITSHYNYCIRELYEYYKIHYPSVPLFVNTMGWITGTGGDLLQQIKTVVEPTHVVGVQIGNILKNISACEETAYIFRRQCSRGAKRTELCAPFKRSLAILAYLGRCQKTYDKLVSLNAIKAYCIPWKHVAVHVCYNDMASDLLLYSLNGSWVALCCVDDSNILKSEDESMFNHLESEPFESECLGFGVVQSIDATRKVFRIITPETLQTLRRVNAIVKGNINLTDTLYSNQKEMDSIPYAMKLLGKSSLPATTVRKRTNRSLIHQFPSSE